MELEWMKGVDGYELFFAGDRYRLRKVNRFAGKPIWWLYINGSRYTPSGRFEDCMHFQNLSAGKLFTEKFIKIRTCDWHYKSAEGFWQTECGFTETRFDFSDDVRCPHCQRLVKHI